MEEQNQDNRFSGMSRQETLREARRQIFHSGMLALAALVVIAVACYAWFASNKSVTGNVGTVSAGVYGFELASIGDNGAFDAETPTDYTVPEGQEWSGHEGYIHTAGMQEICWKMSNASNLGNGTGDSGIRPGSSGKLEFYVIPKQEGEINLTFRLSMIPMGSDRKALMDETAQKLLHGHLLFAYAYTIGGETKSDLISLASSEFKMKIPNAQLNQEIKVTLNWFWPYELSDAKGHAQYGDTLAKWLQESDRTAWFYYNDDATVSVGDTSERQLSEYYDKADQYIGDHVDWVILRMTAVME